MSTTRTNQQWRVLVVEDLPRIQMLIRDVVEQRGLFIVESFARTEQAAIEAYTAIHHEVLIVDLMLAGGSGLSVIKTVRHMPGGLYPLIIVLTNHVSPILEQACRQAGADHFLDKSKDFVSIHSLLEQALAGRH
ncbi:response regulator [Chitinivorax sp. B]|uniref:response regulator n=1 Tax=Chitinivorax sp. B TaxID=2502235 RepID=UPI001484DDD0|nr:response regulator [Chitinivorax sp. B]